MDNMDTCCLEDQKKMDSNKVWQWRIMCGKEHSVRLEPFHHSNRIGLNFNVASNTQKQIDLQLVTNGIILEVCDFAKTVNESKGHFITNILGNNFDLGLENEQQLTDLTAQILHKVKHLIKKPPKDKKEVFTLFDTSSKPECKTNIGLNMASAERKTESFVVEMDDTDDSGHGDEYTCSQAASKECMKTESLLEDMEAAHGDDSDDKDEFKDSGAMSAEELMEDASLPKFPYCEEIRLNLDVGSKQSLDPGLLTKGVMLELVHFTKILTASFRLIVLGVLEHNFELDLKSQQGKDQIWFKILHLLKRRYGLITTGSEISTEFTNEPFSFQTNHFKGTRDSALSNMELQQNLFQEVTKRRWSGLQSKQEKMAMLAISERANKGHRRGKSKDMETNTLSHHTELCTTPTAEGDHCQTGSLSEFDLDSDTGNEFEKEQEEIEMENYRTCPQGESDVDSDKVTNSGNSGNQDHKSCSLYSDISRESEASCRDVCAPFITTDIPSSLTCANAKSITYQPDERELGGGEDQTQTPKNAPNKCDMEQEELETENHMWRLRANRVKQILSTKELTPFWKSKSMGLQFNVGFGPKQNFSVDSLLDPILLEIARFAIAMNSSQQNFIMEILEYNFDISLESEYQRDIFTCEIMKRVRQLKDCEDAVKFSKEVFELHGPIPSISMANQSVASVNAELSSISRMEECDVACGFPPHLQAETKEHISQKCVDLYPFCKDINLKLHVNKTRPNKKLDINKLTFGAMTEVTNFAEKLCGTFEQICVDILKHNLDLDSQCGDSDLAGSIVARIPALVEQRKLSRYVKSQKKIDSSINDSSTNVKLDSKKNPNSDAASAGSSQAAVKDQDVNSSLDMDHQHLFEIKLWQLRANHIQQILSLPHEEHCPLYSYSRCKKLGIDFNVGSGVKQNIDPKLLTNGIMIELGTFATAVLSAQKYFITEILEYNFHLYFDNELYRRSFTEKTLLKIQSKKLLKRNDPQMKTHFELHDTKCIPENTCERILYCPKCYQVRNHKHRQDESGSRHMHHPRPHTMTDAVSDDANCSAQKPAKDPSSTISAIEEMIMDSYPLCKEIGLSLCVDKDQPKDKLDMHLLTHGTMKEVASFAKRLCGAKHKIINDVLQHNFNIGMQASDVNPSMQFHKWIKQSNGWLNEVFVTQHLSNKQLGNVSQMKRAAAIHGSELKESIKKRKLALKTQEKTAKTNPLSKGNCFPIYTEFSFKSGEKEKLDLKQMTKSVCDMDQEEMAPDNYYTCPLGESDLDSDELTDLENSGSEDNLGIPKHSLSSDTSSIPTVNSDLNPWFASQPDEIGLGGDEEQTQPLKNAPNKCDVEQEELETENMWKLRANRVKQILSTKEFFPFVHSKKFFLEFKIGFGPKKNFSVDSLTDSILLEIAKFAIAMNSSQQNFIMEILEYNFDISLESEYQRDIFTCEIMNRVRQLKDCEDAVKFSKEVFELHGPIPSISMANQSVASVNAELGSISRMEECDVACGFPPHSQAGTKEHISQRFVDLHPFCKEISLKLHINNTLPNKKMDINKLTYGAMTEVTNFAERLCGTFEQICVDILKHNLDLDSQFGDSDLARSIVAQIPAVLEQRKLSSYVKSHKNIKSSINYSSSNLKLDSQNHPNSDAASVGSSQAAIIDQEVNSSPVMDHQNEFELKVWQLRANHIQQILSRPHDEQCPFYSYSRCKKLGIDFNVGSGVKQNLDPKLLTNGIMIELGTFATALLSAQKNFITEVLEYNFHLDFINEMYRLAFANQTLSKLQNKYAVPQMKNQFELPDTRYKSHHFLERSLYCPKCYQVKNQKHLQDESHSRHMHHPRPHTLTDAGYVDANCSAQKPAKAPSSTFSAIEEMIMDSYPLCKEIGLSLCVNKDQPKDKLDMHVLTHGTMKEVASFAKRMCGRKHKIINGVLQHNFNIGMQGPDVNPSMQFHSVMRQSNGLLSWLNEVFVFQRLSNKQLGNVRKMKRAASFSETEWKEPIKKRKLALQTQVKNAKTNPLIKKNRCPFSTEIRLTPVEKEKLDFTKSVCDIKQEELAPDNCYTRLLGESDLDSDKLRDLEKSSNEDNLRIQKRSLSSDTSSLPTVNLNLNPWFASHLGERGLSGGEEQTQTLKNAPTECDMEKEELGTENMWKLRANRVKQILSSKEFSPFGNSKRFGLEFNVGFGPKQNFSVDSLSDHNLLDIAKFAIAMNSSQHNFIMEILDYNFDINLESEYHRHIFTCEIMNRVRQLKDCEDAVKFSKEVFELHGPIPSISMANQSVASVNAELSSISRMEECDVACGFAPHSQAETKEHISQKCVDLHPFCKEISLKLQVDNTLPNKKMDINKLTYGAMTEVTNFVEKLCGTFEQICVDILKHNLDLDSQCGDSDLIGSIVAQIPVALDRTNVLKFTFFADKEKKRSSTNINLHFQKNLNSDTASSGYSQAPFVIQEVNRSPDMDRQNELNSKLWHMRENHIQQILSLPHEEHCPLYSYSRCKKLGIDFNVGSGVKQNLDPKLLTNGIMVELHTFATALLSAQKYFITEILEHNFHLYFNNELNRLDFAEKILLRMKKKFIRKYGVPQMKMHFELPDTRCRPYRYLERNLYCPKCYQVRNQKHPQDESDSRHLHHPRPHTLTDAGFADANCSAQKPAKAPSSTFSAIEEMIMDSYPLCKEIGLSLCVDKNQPKDKLDMLVLTHWTMWEVASFAKRLCGKKHKIIRDVLQHNFNIGMQGRDVTPQFPFYREIKQKDALLSWLNEVFVIQSLSNKKLRNVRKIKRAAVIHGSELKETIKKIKLALQTQEKTAKTNPLIKGNHFPISTERSLAPGEKEKLDLKQLTKSVCDMNQEEMTPENDYTRPLGESDLDSDELADLENSGNEDNLGFLNRSLSSDTSSLPTVNLNLNPWFASQPDERGLGGGEEQTQTQPVNICKIKQAAAMHGSELEETIKKRKLALQTKVKIDTHPSVKCERKPQSQECFPICTEMGLDLEVTSKSGEKKKMDLERLTRAVVFEIYIFAIQKSRGYFPNIIYEILDYNFDISSQYHRSLLFSITTASTVNTMAKEYQKYRNDPDTVFKLPFVFDTPASREIKEKAQKKKCTKYPREVPGKKTKKGNFVRQARYRSDENRAHFLDGAKINEKTLFRHEDTEFPTDLRTIEQGSQVGAGCGSLLQGNLQIKKEEYDPRYRNMNPEPDTEKQCYPLHDDIKTESSSADAEHLVPGEHTEQLGYSFLKSENENLQCQYLRNVCAPFITTTDISSSLPIVNANTKSLTCEPDERRLGGGEEQTQTPKYAPTECNMEQEELGTEKNMWKLRANRGKQILSSEEFSLFTKSKKFGLEFNVGFGPKQNFSVDSLRDSILLEIAKFAITINSSQQNFIMEILEYNFDISLESEYQRDIFTCEIMNRVRQLKDCEDAVKFSKEVFELHGPIPSISMANQSVASVNDELSSISRMEECDVACGFPPHSQAETKHISQNCVDLHPFCKEIGLKLHVNKTRPNKKLDINKLTIGAMTEVTNFAEKLCGTFEQICVDILKHNLDLDSQCGDSDLARSIVARIPAIVEEKNVCKATYFASYKKKSSTNIKLDFQNNPNSNASSAGSSQAAFVIQEVNSSPEIERQHELNLKLWQLRANHIQQILSIPHEEHCPLYSYSRCKKVGIDFNVGSGVKQNLDPKLLTNGIIIELITFATDLLSAQKYFITEILEYNFHLDFNNELYRSAFATKTVNKINTKTKRSKMKIQFELPDTRCMPDPSFKRSLYCPKCYQVRNHKHRQDDSGSHHMHHPRPHTMTDAGSADANCSAQKPAKDPSSNFSAIEEMIMDSYPLCKEIGLSLCVDKDQPKDKLDTHILTRWIMVELTNFAKRMCGTKYMIISDVIQHNFNTGMQGLVVTTPLKFYRGMQKSNGLLSWLDEVFVIQPLPISQPIIKGKKKPTADVHGSKWMESIKKRKLTLQTKMKADTLPSVVKKLDVTPKSGEKEKLDLERLTSAVMGAVCGGLFHGNLQIKEEEYDPRYRNMNPEPDTEKCYPLFDVKMESSAADAEHLVPGEPTKLLGYTFLKSENENLQCLLDEPQGCDVPTNTDRTIKTECDTEGVKYLVPVEAAGCLGYSMVTSGQGNESTFIKEEQENMPGDSHSSGVHKKEVGINEFLNVLD